MRAHRKDGAEEGLGERLQGLAVKGQEGLIPDAPDAVKLSVIAEFVFPEIMINAHQVCKRLKAHRAVRCTVKE
ncbi:hypothetical protein D9M69_679190 [compost metagenome]